MEPVKAGHDIVEPEKEDLPFGELQEHRRIGVNSHVNLGGPLEILDDEECNPHEDRSELEQGRRNILSFFDGGNRKGDRETAREENDGIDRPQDDVLLGGAGMKVLSILVAVDGVEEEHAAEEEDLREEEEPHPHLLSLVSICPVSVLTLSPRFFFVWVGSARYHRHLLEILMGRRRRDGPLQRLSSPRVCGGLLAFEDRPDQIRKDDDEADGQEPGPHRRDHVIRVILRRIIEIPSRHSLEPEDEHAEIEDIEADEEIQPADLREFLAVHPARDLGEPVMEPRQDREAGPAEHDIMKMPDDKIGAVEMEVRRQGADDQAREAADGKEKNEGQGKKERRVDFDGALVKGGHPVEYLDPAGHGDEERDEGEDDPGRVAHPAGEHMVPPDSVTDYGDSQGRHADGGVPEKSPSRKDGDDLADDPHGRKDHDVDGRVGVHPEEVFIQDRVAPFGGVEESDAEEPAQKNEKQA